MKISRQWMCLLAAALGCLAPWRSYGEEPAKAEPSLVQQAVSRWDAPTPPPPAPASEAEAVTAPLAAAMPVGDCAACEPGCTPGFQWVIGIEATFFWPQFNRDFLETQINNGLGDQTILSTTANGSAEGTLLAAPRITWGLQGERWGFVGRFWYGSTWGSAFAPSLPDSPTYGITAFDGLRAYTADFEVQRRFCLLNWDSYGFLGVRYASVNNDRSLDTTNSFDGPTSAPFLAASSFAAQQFNGTGLTFGLAGTRPIWCDDSPFKLYFANRYSLLWGRGSVAAETSAWYVQGLDGLSSTNGAAASGNGDLFIAELQLGLQWETCLKCLPGTLFLRTGLEFQYWDVNTGAEAVANSFVLNQATDFGASADARAGNLMFDLIGYTIGGGIMF